MSDRKSYQYWSIAYWILLISWVAGAALNMSRFNGGFLTNYLADLAFPPWYYIFLRGLNKESGELPKLIFIKNWFGVTPERAAVSIFIVGAASELKTFYWPTGFITGTFDIYDIVAYAAGLLICYLADRSGQKNLF